MRPFIMLATYEDFIKQNPSCKKFERDKTMQDIFYFLSNDFSIIQMIDASEAGRPALSPVVENVEHFFMDLTKEYTHTLDNNFTKQAVGLMVKTILEPFGFQSASTYKYDHFAPRTMRIVKTIEEISKP